MNFRCFIDRSNDAKTQWSDFNASDTGTYFLSHLGAFISDQLIIKIQCACFMEI